MPTTLPFLSNKGPPEFPGLIAASVWMNRTLSAQRGELSVRCVSRGALKDLPNEDTMPSVTVWSNPIGWPMATTQSPTLSNES